jgi:hypothetical protein
VMLALWLYATIEGVGSARELERLAQSDAAYRWLADGAPLTYHGLADFRVDSVRVGLSGWPFSNRSFRAIRGPRCVGDKPRASAPRVMFRRAREERGRRGSAQGRSQEERAQGFDDRSRGAPHALSRRRRSPRLQR